MHTYKSTYIHRNVFAYYSSLKDYVLDRLYGYRKTCFVTEFNQVDK